MARFLTLLSVALVFFAEGAGARVQGALVFASTQAVNYDSSDIFVIDDRGRRTNVTASTGVSETNPAWSPDAALLALSRWSSGDADLYTMRRDGRQLRQLTRGAGDDLQPAWSPDGRWIAFVRMTGPRADVWLVAADGSAERGLTDDGAVNAEPTWSPDGERLAFVSGRTFKEVHVVGGDGAGRRAVARRFNPHSPVWLPEGHIAFADEIANEGWGLFVVEPDGSGQRRIRNPCGSALPEWSPHATYVLCGADEEVRRGSVRRRTGEIVRRITFRPANQFVDISGAALSGEGRKVALGAEIQQKEADLFVMAPPGGRPVRITSGPGEDHDPDWSPRRRRIVFVRSSYERHDGEGRLLVLDLRTRKVRPLRPRLIGANPAWSPDGRFVLFARAGGLFIAGLGKKPPRRITRGSDDYPDWSPDGRSIAFFRYERSGATLWVSTPEGKRLQAVHSARGDFLDLAWSPDGRRIAFSTGSTIFVVSVTRRRPRPRRLVWDADNPLSSPTWSPDGRLIAYARGWENDIPRDPGAQSLQLWVVGGDGGGKRPLIRTTGFSFDPGWAP